LAAPVLGLGEPATPVVAGAVRPAEALVVLLEAGVELVGVVPIVVTLPELPATPAELAAAPVVDVVETLGVMLAGVVAFEHAVN
jgi:hypothetical protein